MPRKTLALIVGLIVVTVILFIIALRTGDKESKNKAMQPIKQAMQPTPTPAAHTTLTLSPNPVEVTTGKQGVVDVMIDTSDNEVTGVQLELIYDPLVITNVNITAGKLLQNGTSIINNDIKTGRITYFLAILPNQKLVKGKGTIATITFTAKSTSDKQSYLTLLPATKVAAQGIADSVLKTSSGTVINILSTGAKNIIAPKISITPSVSPTN